MKIRRLYKYYTLGWDYRIMYDGSIGVKHAEVIRTGKNFQDFINDFELNVTKTAIGDELDTILKECVPSDARVSDELGKKMKKFALSIEKTLDSELKHRTAYVLSQKRLGLENLMNKPDQLFASGVFSELNDISKIDFREAGKCISFEVYTAAAFHILRGTEEVLREFYKFKVKKNRIKKLLWYNITQEIKGRKGVPDSLIAVLDSIREDFRNPTSHPEKTYGEDEVQTLFTHCSDVVNRIHRLMK